MHHGGAGRLEAAAGRNPAHLDGLGVLARGDLDASAPQVVWEANRASLSFLGQGRGGGQVHRAVSGHRDDIKILITVGIEQHGQSSLLGGAGEGLVPHKPFG